MPSAILSYALAHGFQYFVFMYFVSGNRRQGRALGRVVTVALLALIGGGVLMLMSDELIWGGGGRFVFWLLPGPGDVSLRGRCRRMAVERLVSKAVSIRAFRFHSCSAAVN